MSQSRLTTALEQGLLTLPEGPLAVLRPPAGYDLSAVPTDRLRITHGFRPDYDYWRATGAQVGTEAAAAPATLVVTPRSKVLARGMIAAASAQSPLVIVDGQRTDGIDSLWKELRGRFGDLPSVTKSHGRLFSFSPDAPLGDWAIAAPAPDADGFYRQPGVFSESGADRGSELLAGVLPARLPSRMADLGAGWGYLCRAVLSREGVTALDLIEAEALALDCARLNITDPRAQFHWADATRFVAEGRGYDGMVMNPPFHSGRASDPGLGQAFITSAARLLAPHGQLWMVANRHLPYEAVLRAKFRQVTELAADGGFKIFHAARPQK